MALYRASLVCLLMLSLLLTVLSAPIRAQNEPGTTGPFENDEGYLLNLKSVDISVLLDLYSRLTGKAVLPSADVSGKVNVINQQRVSKAEAISIIESVLELNGYSTIPSGTTIKIVPKKTAVKRNIHTGRIGKNSEISHTDRVETHILALKAIKADKAKSVVTPLLSDVGNITIDQLSNTLVITDIASNVARLFSIIKELDYYPQKSRPVLKHYRLHHASVDEVENQLKSYFDTCPLFTKAEKPTLMVDKRLRSILVIALPEFQKEVDKVLEVFDRPAADSTVDDLVIRLEYAKATAVADLLVKLLQDKKDDKKAGNEEDMSIVADEATNTLIVSADRSRFHEIREIVKSLDVRNKQVLVKALIMEVTLRSGSSLGVSWQYRGGRGQVESDVGGPIGDEQPFSAAQDALDGFKYAFFEAGKLNAFLNTIMTGSKVNIISSPHIMTVNNKPAEIIVGDEVPYTKDSRVSDTQAVIKTNEYRKVGVKLTVTPRITKSNDVVMDISQEISGLSGVDPDLDAPIFFTREAKASVIVHSESTVVIGGLIKQTTDKQTRKIPILGDIPIIKHAFRRTQRSHEKTELIAFITPIVISSDEESLGYTKTMKDDFLHEVKRHDNDFQENLNDLFNRITTDTLNVPDAKSDTTINSSTSTSDETIASEKKGEILEKRGNVSQPKGLSDKAREIFKGYRGKGGK